MKKQISINIIKYELNNDFVLKYNHFLLSLIKDIKVQYITICYLFYDISFVLIKSWKVHSESRCNQITQFHLYNTIFSNVSFKKSIFKKLSLHVTQIKKETTGFFLRNEFYNNALKQHLNDK